MTLQPLRLTFPVMIALSALLSGTSASAEPVERTEAHDRLTWRYAEFVSAFRSRNWDHVCSFVTDETQAGFGPGQMGCEGVSAVFAEDEACWEDMLLTLRQGCKMTDHADGCSAPPQLASNIAYQGARASFSYNADTDELTAGSLICAGD